MLGDGLAGAVEDALQVIKLTRQLHLNDDDMSFAVFRLYVDAVEFIGVRILVSLALKKFDNLYIFI